MNMIKCTFVYVYMVYMCVSACTGMYIHSLAQGKVVRGWIDLTSGREVPVKKCIKYFDDVIQR